jgi:catechol 2,3-dioxygenase
VSYGDLAHIGHVELLKPEPERSLRFFVDALGMEQGSSEGPSVFLRGFGDYQRYSLKLTEAPEPGLGHLAIRTRTAEALAERVGAIEAAGLGVGLIDGDVGHGPAYRFTDPDGHVLELSYETERYEPGGNRDYDGTPPPHEDDSDYVARLAGSMR